MDVNGWLLILALFFTVLLGGVLLVAVRVETKVDYLNKTLIRLLGSAPPARSATVTSRSVAQHRQGE